MFLVFVKMRSGLHRPGILLVLVLIILDHKKSYLVSLKNFHFFQFLAKIGDERKNHKK
jgi:hypothetical protein